MELKISVQIVAFGKSLRQVEQRFLFRLNDDLNNRY